MVTIMMKMQMKNVVFFAWGKSILSENNSNADVNKNAFYSLRSLHTPRHHQQLKYTQKKTH